MKKHEEINNKELSIIYSIILIICIIAVIIDVGIIIENIVWYDSYYNLAIIILASIAIACAIYAIINKIKRDKRLKKKKKR